MAGAVALFRVEHYGFLRWGLELRLPHYTQTLHSYITSEFRAVSTIEVLPILCRPLTAWARRPN
jgi:hypothetical protein